MCRVYRPTLHIKIIYSQNIVRMGKKNMILFFINSVEAYLSMCFVDTLNTKIIHSKIFMDRVKKRRCVKSI